MTPTERKAKIRQVVGNTPGDFDKAALRYIADGPLVDPSHIYLPCGKLSKAEADAREAAQIERLA